MRVVDVLVIGSGIAGLSAAIKLARRLPRRQIAILTKDAVAESNTRYAQGGISVVTDLLHDSLESHIEDTLRAGDGLCREDVVRMVVGHAAESLQELIALGTKFDHEPDGTLSLGREGGHRHRRIVHRQDTTGAEISATLIANVAALSNISLLTDHAVIDLLVDDHVCQGVMAIDLVTGKLERFVARATILATGGVGQLYRVTTNPRVATGDGIAMAVRAGAKVSHMEFIQFHPTALAYPGTNPRFLISEAVRGHGAHLLNARGERFMFRYHPDGELACRDVVARAIATEARLSSRGEVFLDCAPIAHEFAVKFPAIYQTCRSLGLDPCHAAIPVAPAAHYLCGGIDVDLHARTSIARLYACGECAHTGLHGANRLASNSLLEALVFAETCCQDIAGRLDQSPIEVRMPKDGATYVVHASNPSVFEPMKGVIRDLMNDHVGIVRINAGLREAADRLVAMKEELEDPQVHSPCREWYALRDMLDAARLIVDQSLRRTENRGAYYNADYETRAKDTQAEVVSLSV